jgi:hypothetical protein
VRQANRRKFHYIYKTTCVITGNYYIGMHSTDNIQDDYLGSGKRLTNSINKHGKENHIREILEFLPDRDSLRKREAMLVREDTITDLKCMNLVPGGNSGRGWSPEACRKGAATSWNKIKNDPVKYEDFVNRSLAVLENARAEGKISSFTAGSEWQKIVSAASNTPTAKAKRKAKMTENGHQQGETNSQFGKIWMYSKTEQKNIKVCRDDVDTHPKSGWLLGRKMKF